MTHSFSILRRVSIVLILISIGFLKDISGQNGIAIRSGYNESWLYDKGSAEDYRYGEPEFDEQPAFYLGFSYYRSKYKHIRFESSLNLTSKFVSLNSIDGGNGSYTTIDADYKLFFADISIYPALVFGDKLKFIGSIRPNIGLMFASLSSGEKSAFNGMSSSNSMSGWAEEFSFLSLDLALNARIEYTLTKKIGVLLECQYSKGLNDISNNGVFEYNFQNILIGTGITIQLSELKQQ